ncbi:MAG: ABC transporter ATP-binding protein [Ginsengibacter sp.]
MKICLSNVGKRFNRDWIFKNLNYQFQPGKHYAITGPNGSGKSTLLQIISGSTISNEGAIEYWEGKEQLAPEKVFQKISFTAPYLELIEEMTFIEFLNFHQKMKGWINNFSSEDIIEILQLEKSSHKQIRYFSSGMKQRVKLAQALFSNVSAIFLDEPLTNLDEEGNQLYHFLIEKYCSNRLTIISSNDEKEYSFCTERLFMNDYK